jgi:chemotaxis protein MotB
MSRRRNRRVAESLAPPSHERWLVSYADFMTLLFAVFVVLFAFSRYHNTIHTVSTAIHSGFDALSAAPAAGGASPNPSIETNIAPPADGTQAPKHFDTGELSKELQGVLGDSISKQEIVMQQTPDGLVISLRELGFFNSGEAQLLPGAADKLKATAKVLMQHGLEVRVEGHSDDQPIHNAIFQSNWELSTARAMSVLSLLVNDGGFPENRISVAGYGSQRPVSSNSTADGRKMNRRVDLIVVAPRTHEERLH